MTEEENAYIAKARRYLRSADILRSENDLDSAASRIYYAMFYCAEAVLWSAGLRYTSHRGVISGFGQHFAKTGRLPPEMHRWLRDAFDMRQQGDYQAISAIQEKDVLDFMAKADQFVRQAEAFLEQEGRAGE